MAHFIKVDSFYVNLDQVLYLQLYSPSNDGRIDGCSITFANNEKTILNFDGKQAAEVLRSISQ
jgi:hypothetical protein